MIDTASKEIEILCKRLVTRLDNVWSLETTARMARID